MGTDKKPGISLKRHLLCSEMEELQYTHEQRRMAQERLLRRQEHQAEEVRHVDP